jgi:hypothetical protein
MGAFEDLHRNRVTGSLAMFDRMIFKGRLTALCKNNGARCLAGVVGDDDAVPLAEHDGVHSVPQVELGYDAADVALHGCFRYDQPLRGLVVRVSTGDEPEHFALAVGLAVRATGPAPRAYLAPSSTRFARCRGSLGCHRNLHEGPSWRQGRQGSADRACHVCAAKTAQPLRAPTWPRVTASGVLALGQ